MKRIALSLLLLGALAASGCKAKKLYPDADPGWHSPDYGVVFGRLQRKPARDPDEPPLWLIRYDLGKDPYRGEFALTPAEKLVGYSGGEMVEIRGRIKSENAPAGYSGTWYEVHDIRIWASYSGK
jgi:hypothetical protein